MTRLRYNGVLGGVDLLALGANLTDSATSITFSGALNYAGGAVPTIADPSYLPLVIDPDSPAEEVVWLTAYTTGTTTGTIVRGQEGTARSAHTAGAGLVHGPTTFDVPATVAGWRWVSFAPQPSAAAAGVTTDDPSGYYDEQWCVAVGTKVYLGGACEDIDCPSFKTWEYDTVTDVWTQKADCDLAHENAAAAALPDGRVIVAGGDGYTTMGLNPSGPYESSSMICQIYDPVANTWTRKADMPSARQVSTGVWFPGTSEFLIIGNGSGWGDPTDILAYDPAGNSWRTFHALPAGGGKRGVFAFVIGGELYVGGGQIDNSGAEDDAIWHWTGSGWTIVHRMPNGVAHAGITTDGTYAYIVGGIVDPHVAGGYPTMGINDVYSSLVLRFNPNPVDTSDDDQWIQFYGKLEGPVGWGQAVIVDGVVYSFGGGNHVMNTKLVPAGTLRLEDLANFEIATPWNKTRGVIVWDGFSAHVAQQDLGLADIYGVDTNPYRRGQYYNVRGGLDFVDDGGGLTFQGNPEKFTLPQFVQGQTFERRGAKIEDLSLLVSGRIHLVAIAPTRRTNYVQTVNFISGATGSSGLTYSWAGIASSTTDSVIDYSDLKVLVVSTNNNSAWTANSVRYFNVGVTAPFDRGTQTYYWIFICVAASTMPTLWGVNGKELINGMPPCMSGYANTGRTLPPSIGDSLVPPTATDGIPYAWFS